jgi:hypothetical protein
MKQNIQLNLTCVILILLAVVLGCSESGNTSSEAPKKAVPPAYIGTWTGQDGSTVTFRSDWSGDYKSGGKSVNGGTFEIDEAANEIRFMLLGFDAGKYKIDAPPKGDKMKLDGMEYRRTGGFDASDSETKSPTTSGEVPTESELRPIAAATLRDFNQAVRQADFSEFYANVSEMWQSQTTAAEMTEAFKSLYKQNLDFTPKNDSSLVFTAPPALESDEVLKTEVNYPTVKGTNARFRLRYVREDGVWKLLGIRLNP